MAFLQTGIIVLCLLSLPIVVFLQCFTESVFVLNPLIDTVLPEGFSAEKFEKVKPGMTKAEVLRLVPKPLEGSDQFWSYGNDGAAPFGDYAWFLFEIEFDADGRVLKTGQQRFHD